MARKSNRKQKIAMLVSLVLFGSTTLLGALRFYSLTPTLPTQAAQPSLSLDEQARQYEAILQREPENQTALTGLTDVRLRMQDLYGAIDPLEKLVKLNPDRSDYAELLARVKRVQAKS